MKTKLIILTSLLLTSLGTVVTSCGDLLDTDSDQVMFDKDHNLDNPADTVYSVIGIINQMQKIADRTVLLGEVRGDLVTLSDKANVDLQAIANFSACGTAYVKNKYNEVSDYYSVINNCNYFLANVDTALAKRNEKIFEKEYAVVKAYRAWTYLQLAQIYGRVPLVTVPILSASQALEEQSKPWSDIYAICDFFIQDIKDYVDTETPNYGTINGLNSKQFYIPIRALLGDLCLWSGNYRDAAQYYRDYFTQGTEPVNVGTSRASWMLPTPSTYNFNNGYGTTFRTVANLTTYIPMDSCAADGIYSQLNDLYSSTLENNFYYEITPSRSHIEYSRSLPNCILYSSGTATDTIYAPTENDDFPDRVGDLRLPAVYTSMIRSNVSADYSSDYQLIQKYSGHDHVGIYRPTTLYLRYAEALNRAGFPQGAFCVLKYGMTNANVNRYISQEERDNSGTLMTFSIYDFTTENTAGIHSFGSGVSSADSLFVLPELKSKEDSIAYVEDKILEEMALETIFEGNRFYDLIRIADRRGDASLLADKVARRQGEGQVDAALRNKLLTKNNWYLPLK